MGRRHLCPLRIGTSLARAIELLKLLDIDQLDCRRVLIVLNRRLVLVVTLANAQKACLAVTTDDNCAARTKVNSAGAVHDDIHLRRARHKEIRRRQTQADTVLTPLFRQFFIEIPMPEAHIRQETLRIGLNVCAHMIRIQECLFKRLNGEVKCHRTRIDRRFDHTLNIEGDAEDRLFEPTGHNILGKAIMIEEELILLNADVGANLRILRNEAAQALLLLMRDILCVEFICNPLQETLCAALLCREREHILLVDDGCRLILQLRNIPTDLLPETKRTLIEKLPERIFFQM